MKKISKEKLPTAITSKIHPIHRWYNFVAGYSPEYVFETINNFERINGHKPIKIYDPFGGCATTNVVANMENIPSIGIERNPIFYKLGKSKIKANVVIEKIDDILNDFEGILEKADLNFELNEKLSSDALTFLEKLFHIDSLKKLILLRDKVESYESEDEYLAGFIFLSKIIDMVTHSKTDGVYKAPTSLKKSRTVSEAINLAIRIFDEDRMVASSTNNLTEYKFGSSVESKIDKESIDLTIFSPPYLNNFDFAEMTRMHMYFWNEAKSWKEISEKHRNHMIVNTTTALKLVKENEQQQSYKDALPKDLVSKLEPLVVELDEERKNRPSRKNYHLLIYPYFGQMQQVLKNVYEAMRKNGRVHIVVSDAAFYGIYIDAHNYLIEIMMDIGFDEVTVARLRTRGDKWILDKRTQSDRQLGEYEIIGAKY